ncbi:hypothetical protein C8Q77DRAFT_1110746 [Trametes polyzona]|nr:hypothetical protein C8Q77DRAFT_1110746 [Trametes polyzona]
MVEINADGGTLAHIPDDLTIPQFILDSQHPLRPAADPQRPWLIEESTGRAVRANELRARISGLANAFNHQWNIGDPALWRTIGYTY